MRRRLQHTKIGAAATAAILGALTVTALGACGSSSAAPVSTERFTDAVESAGLTREPLTIADVIGSGWDQGVMVCPYDPVDAVESAIGTPWTQAPSTANEDFAYVVVATGDTVLATIRLDRSVVDPCSGTTLLSQRSFGPTMAFRVGRAPWGNGWILGPDG